ncbi:MAG: hypothetical protein K2W96_00680 [Gemmataceae bacterium]|nr:hypothetical protein [Gemmataceae bacterium]
MPRSLKRAPLLAGLWLAAQAGLAWADPGAAGSCGAYGSCGPKIPCPPKFCHVFEDGPKIKFKRGCPRPLCDPCNLERYGYYQTCWSPWPYANEWAHCQHPTPSQMLPPPRIPPYTPRVPVVSPDREREKDRLPDRERERPDKAPVLPTPRPDDPEVKPMGEAPVLLPDPRRMDTAIRLRR